MKKFPPMNHRNLEAALENADASEAAPLREVWRLLGDASDVFPSANDTAAARVRLLDALDDVPFAGEAPRVNAATIRPLRPAARRPPRIGSWWRIAAVVIVLLLLGLGWWLTPITHRAPLGDTRRVTLPDGSTAHLNSGSMLSYGRSYSLFGRRSVELAGEALFDVESALRPFTVTSFDARVTVLGTRFNVRAWPGELAGETTVAVESGRVSLSATKAGAVVVEAGQSRRIENGAVSADSLVLSVEDALAWRNGGLIFKDIALGAVLADVRRRFATDVRIEPAAIETTKISLALRTPTDVEGVVRDIAGALNLRYRALAHGYVLSRPAEQ